MIIEKIKMEYDKIYTKNRNAYNEYEIIYSLECGMVLQGIDVKNIKNNKINLTSSFGEILNKEVFLRNVGVDGQNISIKLLLNKNQIVKLTKELESDGVTLIPLIIYLSKNRIKCELGLARGLKKFDKRESIKNKEIVKSKTYKIKL